MLDITDTQVEILKILLENRQKISYSAKFGLTSNGFARNGVNRRTFMINRHHLYKQHFIYPVKWEQHGEQNWSYYDITPLGVMAYLKNQGKKSFEKSLEKSGNFFPLITKHYDILKKMYEGTLDYILKKSIDQIQITPWASGVVDGKKFISDDFNEIMYLQFRKIGASFTRNSGLQNPREIHELKKIAPKLYADYEINRNTIIDRFTFVFYFNLINLPDDGNKFVHIILNHESYFKNSRGYIQRLKKNPEKVIQIIKKDPDLRKLFNETLDEIKEGFKEPPIINQLSNSLN